jgi:alpha/beta hydrolase fold
MGDSAGGGLAAGVAIVSRDPTARRPARQLLLYPMLDFRTATPDQYVAPFAVWSYDDNVTAWNALLGTGHEYRQADPSAAPGRLQDAVGLSLACIEVGQLDIFRDEDVRYALTLSQAGVPVELHLHPGAARVRRHRLRRRRVTPRGCVGRLPRSGAGQAARAHCPKLRSSRHGSWYCSADLSAASGQRRGYDGAASHPGGGDCSPADEGRPDCQRRRWPAASAVNWGGAITCAGRVPHRASRTSPGASGRSCQVGGSCCRRRA